ncbi:MAG: cytochrome c biogenesis protein, transmembrane region [uncultured bacterium]|nr:MAG: cytochrome c biogenesis protein, transmembrane region [uncultured bacterium]
MDFLISASFIASFLAGIAALFAPCCITVLLPTYFASIFKQKTTVFLMTFVYFLGILSIFLPLGLGVALFTQIFSQYHDTVFLIGGIFLVFLGLSLLLGQQFSLPFRVHPKLPKEDFISVYILGIFSAIATTCCAPVLAGVLTLSALPGSFILGGIYTLAYVLGMVLPLFIIASFLDKIDFTKKFFAFRKSLSYNILGQKIHITFANLLSGLTFLILGIIIIYFAKTEQLTSHSQYQVMLNIYLTKFIKLISGFATLVPEVVWALIFVGIALFITYFAIKKFRSLKKRGLVPPKPDPK